MTTSRETHDNLAIALDALEMGYAPIPIIEGTKMPAVKWKEWQSQLPPETLVHQWFSVRRNIAIVCTGLVVFDCDAPDKAELVLAECGDTPHRLSTPRGGVHLGYRRRKGLTLLNQVKIKGLPIDIRTDGGLELIPASVTQHGAYRWLGEGLKPASELPLGHISWTRERTRRQVVASIEPSAEKVMVRRALAWVDRVEGAVSGQGGHNKTFRVACKLAALPPRGFGLTPEQAWPILLAYSERCEPPWSERELIHKLEDALKKGR